MDYREYVNRRIPQEMRITDETTTSEYEEILDWIWANLESDFVRTARFTERLMEKANA